MALREELTQTTTSPISLSERAASELKTLIQENDKTNAALRVWVAGGGCSGLQYGMALDDAEPEAGDVVLNDQGVKIYVDEMSLKYMTGATVDYVDDTLGGGFKIENPNAVKSCGCGSSFSTDEEGMEGLSNGGGCGSCGSH
jgi:iron-sulfur cluster assembly accessory protein